MDPTTLVTFLFKAPPEARTVELLGSWDNFSHGYKMHNDRRRGRGFWSGCFNFKDIVFDGDRADWSKPRSGGLKQGGTYWYYYRLNDAIEAFDDATEYTQGCPLLPGQTVNVMDVPTELGLPPSRRRSATVDVIGTLRDLHSLHTFDPADKWATLEPPPVSKVHARCISDLALNGRLETKPVSFREPSPPVSPIREGPQPGLAAPSRHSTRDYHSVRSRFAWSSAPPSRGDASVYDAFAVVPADAHGDSSNGSSPSNAHQSGRRPGTRDGGSALQGFDFAFGNNTTRHSLSRTGDDDLDGSSYILEPADSPPLSAYDSVDWRFTVPPAAEQQPLPHNTHPRRPASDPTHRFSTASSSAPPSADSCSPTFSAATISSSGGGLNTPFRLSAGFPSSISSPDPALAHVAERLRQLGSEDSAASLASDHQSQQHPQVLGHYALPVARESATTLGKASSGRTSIAPRDLDAPPLPREVGGHHHHHQYQQEEDVQGGSSSFADAIFSELGYLGASIA